MNTIFTVVLAALGLIAVWSLAVYNKLIALIEAIRNNQRQIDVQLDRRFKVFQSLIECVKHIMDYEKTTLKEVVALRNHAELAKQSGDDETRIATENKISTIASGLHVVFEQYPTLTANQNVLQLQEEIISTENKLTFAKQALNDSIERYNALKKSFFESMVTRFFSTQLDQSFSYWGLPEDHAKNLDNYTVKF